MEIVGWSKELYYTRQGLSGKSQIQVNSLKGGSTMEPKIIRDEPFIKMTGKPGSKFLCDTFLTIHNQSGLGNNRGVKTESRMRLTWPGKTVERGHPKVHKYWKGTVCTKPNRGAPGRRTSRKRAFRIEGKDRGGGLSEGKKLINVFLDAHHGTVIRKT